MARKKSAVKKKDALSILKKITERIKAAKYIDMLEVCSEAELENIPTHDWMEKRPTGWINIELKMRWLKGERP